MTESGDTAPEPKKRGGLNAMRIADLKSMAAQLGIAGADGMRKPQLVEAVRAAQSGTGRPGRSAAPDPAPAGAAAPESRAESRADSRAESRAAEPAPDASTPQEPQQQPQQQQPQQERRRTRQRESDDGGAQGGGQQDAGQQDAGQQDAGQQDAGKQDAGKPDGGQQDGSKGQQSAKQGKGQQAKNQQGKGQQGKGQQGKGQQGKGQNQNPNQQGPSQEQQKRQQQERQQQADRDAQDAEDAAADRRDAQDGDDGDEGGASRRSRRRRGRDSREPGPRPGRRSEPDTQVLEDDVLVPAAGILDVLENYAFVRTSGYLPGVEDVYLSLSLVRKFGLRRGDAVQGQVRQPREGERREKFNPMVRIDSVNSQDPETARSRPEFDELTAVHPTERIRLETGPDDLTGRVLDLVAPIGKGQRCLVRASPRSGRTALLQSLSGSITSNCPEAHLMVVLLHERPEEITDFRRAVAGEVIASGFDRQPADHVGVAELAVERAKRLVELGHDVVVLLDGLTRLARAHHQAGTGSAGRTLPGGVDVSALLPPKQFFGAARALEQGGSLTVIATASVDRHSVTDAEVVDELEGTANAEVHLSRTLADAGLHPAVDVAGSGTRHDDLLLGAEERDAVTRLRSQLAAQPDAAGALGLLLDRLRATRTNIELLTRATKNGR